MRAGGQVPDMRTGGWITKTPFQKTVSPKYLWIQPWYHIFDWFVNNKLSIHFGDDKTKSILFSTKTKKKIGRLEIKYGNINMNRYSKVTYLGCEIDEILSEEAMALNVINKINSRVHFLYRKNGYLLPYLERLLSNAIIQTHFNYACSAWYTNLNKKFKSKLQTIQNKCIRFCLQLDSRSYIGIKEFE